MRNEAQLYNIMLAKGIMQKGKMSSLFENIRENPKFHEMMKKIMYKKKYLRIDTRRWNLSFQVNKR